MPMMQDLLTRLQESPPENEQELMSALEDTGYDLVMREEPMDSEEAPMEAMEEDAPEDMGDEEEMPEDMGPDDAAVELDIIKEMMPTESAMDMAPAGATPRMMMQVKTRKAAKKALKEG